MSEAQQHWNQRYETRDIPWETGYPCSELQRVVKSKQMIPCRALELGCGLGGNAVWLAEQGFDVTAVDISDRALQTAEQRAQQAGVSVRFVADDVRTVARQLEGPFPFVFDRGCYHVVRRSGVDEYLQTLRQVTSAGSTMLVLTGNARERREPGPPVVTEQQLIQEIGSLFDIVDLCEFRFDLSPADETPALGFSCLGIRRSG